MNRPKYDHFGIFGNFCKVLCVAFPVWDLVLPFGVQSSSSLNRWYAERVTDSSDGFLHTCRLQSAIQKLENILQDP